MKLFTRSHLIFRSLILYLLFLTLQACGGGGGGGATTTSTLNSIKVTPAVRSIAVGTTQSFTAIGSYSDGSTRDLSTTATWNSSDTSIASLNTDGVATAVSTGVLTITATSAGVSNTSELTVTSAILDSLVLSPDSTTIALGTTQKFIVTGIFDDETAQDLTSIASWASSDDTVATINTNGLVSAVAVGNFSIDAVFGGMTASSSVNDVTAATLDSIAVSPATASIGDSASLPFTATGTFSDGSTQDLTSSVTWTSNDSGIATINANGVATGVNAVNEPAVITAAINGLSSTADLSVNVTLFLETFADNSKGWNLDTDWEIGYAILSTNGEYDNNDPGTDTTPTADNGIAGVVIGGNAPEVIHPYYYLTSPVINIAVPLAGETVMLNFQRWLNSDYTDYMKNTVEVFDGVNWVIIWETFGDPGIQDSSWSRQSFDITAYANPALQIRFGFNIDSTGVYTVGSWSLDDINIVSE